MNESESENEKKSRSKNRFRSKHSSKRAVRKDAFIFHMSERDS